MEQTATVEQTAVKLEVAEDGTLTIPADLVRQIQGSPDRAVVAIVQADELVLKRDLSRREKIGRIEELLRFALKDVEWSEVEEGRKDRPRT